MLKIECKLSKKGSKYLVLTYDGIYVTFDTRVIERIAMQKGISNIDLFNLDADDSIII